ncbi:MAG: HEAT repeat domain-containing protein, partial [Bacteroidota bacterium]
MFRAIFKALNVRPEEERQVTLLLAKGFFMGVFIATFQIGAETLFLNRLGDYLKEAILASGLLGVFTTAVFSRLQRKVSFAKLAVFNLIVIFIITGAIYASFNYAEEQFVDYVIFVMFALVGPFTAVLLLGFWGVFGRMFDLRQSKRIIGWIDTGQLSAAIIASYTIPLLTPLIPDTTVLLIISGVSILLSSIFLLMVTARYDLKQAEMSSVQSDENVNAKFSTLIKDRYVILLSTFLIFSMVAFTFVQYSFQEVTQQQYPEEDQLRNFLATFNGSILVLGFLLQTFVNDKIIGVYGLKVSLLILPIILVVFTIASAVSGSFFGFSVTDSPDTFIWFFLFISLSRLFNYSLRDSLENPTFKLYFMPLDNRVRFDIQTKVEGVINESARLLAGLLILLLSYLSFFELIHYSYALIFIVVGYGLIIGKLHNQYRNKIQVKLESQKANYESEEDASNTIIKELENTLESEETNKAVFSFKLLEKVNPTKLPIMVNKLLDHNSGEIKAFAQERMNEINGLSVSDKYVISYNKQNSGVISGRYLVPKKDMQELFMTGSISKSRVSGLTRSDSRDDRQYVAELLGNSPDKENISYLIELLNDVDPKVRLAAIKAARKKYNPEVLSALIDNLCTAQFSNESMNTLVLIGSDCLDALDAGFYKTGQNPVTMVKIIEIFGQIGGEKARDMLWNKMDYPDKVIVSQVLWALGESGFKANISQITRIKYAIESDVEDISWNLAALSELPRTSFSDQMEDALREENEHDLEHIYTLLSMLYDAASIRLVKENIESGTNEGVTYALELLDVFLSEDLKQKIIPLLDDISDYEKAKRLEVFFPRDRLDSQLVLKHLINRDFNQTNRWSKACAIYQIGLLKIKNYEYDLIANLFNPDLLVSEVAAWSLNEIDPTLYMANIDRVGIQYRMRFNALINPPANVSIKPKSKLQKVLFLKGLTMFEEFSGLILARMVDMMDEEHLAEGDSITIDNYYNNVFYIVLQGDVDMYERGSIKSHKTEGEFIGEVIELETHLNSNIITALSDSILLKIQ